MPTTHPLYPRKVFPDYQLREFPKMLYHPTEKPVTVYSEDQQAELGAGWHTTPAAAGIEVYVNPSEATAVMTRPVQKDAQDEAPTGSVKAAMLAEEHETLLALAAENGVKVNPKWPNDRLKAEIEKATGSSVE